MKNFYKLSIFIIVFLVAGCSNGQNNNQNQNNQNNTQTQNTTKRPTLIENDNFMDGTLDDLEIGKNIMVIGKENGDGSITATQIIIGENFGDFDFMKRRGTGSHPNFDQNQGTDTEQFQNTSERKRVQARQNTQNGPGGFQGLSEEERAQTRERMSQRNANMTDEERAQFMKERTNRQTNGGSFSARTGTTRVNGEIIDISSNNIITVKLEEGGSRLIFISDSTKISIINLKNQPASNQ